MIVVHKRVLALVLAFLIVAGAQAQQSVGYFSKARGEFPIFKVLVFSRTEGFRHESISAGLTALNELGAANGFTIDATEDDAFFTSNDLTQYQAIVFLNTTGDILDQDEEAAIESYMAAGGGWVGIHAAADTEYDWGWYEGLVGAYFESHPAGTPTATINIVDRVHPATASLPHRWVRTDEWYNYQSNPRGSVHVLAALDESTYAGGNMGVDHPIAWCGEYSGGRTFYTGMGHTSETYSEPQYREHLLQGLQYAAGIVPGECGATIGANFEKKVLDSNTDNPMSIEITPDGRVLYVERDGRLQLYSPVSGTTSTAGTINVVTSNEDGLLGIALDPGFESNSWVYLFYSPAGAAQRQLVSRFTLTGDLLDLSSEKMLLEIPVQRAQCCHSSGELEFDSAGNLYISTGDNTNPFASDGFAPIDERSMRSPWDAQGSSGNANDLRGKILRITPQPDGTYTIPDGNLFPSDGSAGKAEVYVMGVRNPFRFAIDPATDWLYWGDVGPDASAADGLRGPAGLDEWNQARAAGNFGWPYCVGPNRAYVDYNFATSTSGSTFSCASPVNDSPNNTGPSNLPPAVGAWIWYPYGDSPDFAAVPSGSGRTAMAGPIYKFDETVDPTIRFPEYYAGAPLLYEWSRNFILEARLDENGDLLALQRVLPNISLSRPISMKFGPDGALYVIEWGTGFGGNNDDSQVVRIEFVRGSRSPVAFASADVTSGGVPLTVQFSSTGTYDPDPGDAITFSWDFDGNGTSDSQEPNPSHIYAVEGTFVASLTVEDLTGNRSVASITITAGNSMPSVSISKPVNGGFYNWGDQIAFEVSAIDAEDGSTADGTIDCGDVVFQPFVGHDDHSHPLNQIRECAGVFETESGHGSGSDNVFQVVEVSYTDAGGGAAGALTARTQHILRPKRLEAEYFDTNNGIQVEPTGDVAGGGQNIGYVDDGDHVSYKTVNLQNISFVTYRVASAGPGGIIEVRVDSPTGERISSTAVEPTGQWQVYREVSAPISDPGGTHELFFVFRATSGSGGLYNINWIDFIGDGVAVPSGNGDGGLFGKYYGNVDFTGRSVERLDAKINFDWGTGDPFPLLGGDTFSVRWAGWIEAGFSENYTFYTRSSDGVRLRVNDELLIDQWVNQATSEHISGPVALVAGERYPIVLEYFEDAGEAQVHLSWSSPSTPHAVVPPTALFPDSSSTIVVDPEIEIPRDDLLSSAYPNPTTGHITVDFRNEKSGPVTIELLDLLGRRVDVLLDERKEAGSHTVEYDGQDLAVGTYICRLQTATGFSARMVVIVR